MPLPLHDWIALSDRGLCEGKDGAADPQGLLDNGLFVAELALPLDPATLLLNQQADDGWPRTFALFHDEDGGLVLLHRQGNSVARHHLQGPLPKTGGIGRLSFRFDAPARHWNLSFEVMPDLRHESGAGPRISVSGTNPLPLRLADLAALCGGADRPRHPAVLWFGFGRGDSLPARAPWIGLRTPVETARGPVAAGHLKVGDLIETLDNGPMPLLALHRHDLPSKGSFAPVLLRAPFYATGQDLLISADQMIALAGPAVEYLFGEDEVLVSAAFLADGRTALLDQRRAATTSVSLELAEPALIAADGCALLSAPAAQGVIAPATLPRRSLHRYEALTLLSMRGRTGRHRAA